jgi:hypothetical protein
VPRPAALIGDDEVAGSRVLCWTGKKSGLERSVKENPTTWGNGITWGD